jgi:hypothetical protein
VQSSLALEAGGRWLSAPIAPAMEPHRASCAVAFRSTRSSESKWLRIGSVRIPRSGKSDINEVLHILVTIYSSYIVKAVQRKCPDLSP